MNTSRREGRRGFGRSTVLVALVGVLGLLGAACSSSSRNNATTGTTTAGGGAAPGIDTSSCTGNMTDGISGNTITLGTSLPLSGTYSAFKAILQGEQSYFSYVNAQGGVTVAGKKYQIKLKADDDQYDAAKTATNIQSLVTNDHVFGLFNVVGTKNNIGARDFVNTTCVPDLLIASGAVQWGNTKFPWMLGSELVPYPLEMLTFVDYLKQNKPNASIAVLYQSDDFGESYLNSLQQLVKGTSLTIKATAKYDPNNPNVTSQVTSLAASKADAFVLGGTLLACPSALNAQGAAGWKAITYMSGTCVSKLLLSAAGKNADGILTVTPLLDPSDPANGSNAAMQLYKTNIAKYGTGADATDGIVGYGWTTGALMVKILESSPKLDRASVMNTARNLKDVKDVGLQIPAGTWTTSMSPADWFVGETFQLIKWDATAGHSNAVGPLTVDDGKTASLSPSDLLNG
jgi:branched-chain amino acid transport system substrate-binding protein